ncbi:MAG: hypothetical protein ACLT5I_11770, partial [[Clostridium] leptum]
RSSSSPPDSLLKELRVSFFFALFNFQGPEPPSIFNEFLQTSLFKIVHCARIFSLPFSTALL